MEARTRPGSRLVVLCSAVLVAAAACSPTEPPSPATTTDPTPTTTPAAASPSSSASPTSAVMEGPLAGSGSIAIVRADGTLWKVDADGSSVDLTGLDDGVFGFPTWSPDGTLIASTRTTATGTAVVVIDVARAETGLPAVPQVIFDDPASTPFYLSWTPDGRSVSFLASDAGSLKLRLAPADGAAPLDGSGPGAIVGDGSPFYFDWVDPERLFVHIGTGPDAFLGEMAADGTRADPAIESPGSFRNGDVSVDGRFIAYVRDGPLLEDAVVVAARAGSDEYTLPVFGMVALDFDPAGTTLASIGSTEPLVNPEESIPMGPLRLIDAETGRSRTLLEGSVASFAWSPDGSTIAVIRLVPTDAGSPGASASPAASAAPATNDVRLTFIDVASGRIRSDAPLSPGETFVRSLLLYFDQYALSHRLWAPDSSAIAIPQRDATGATHVDVFSPDGGDPIELEGEIGFWSP